MIKYKKLYEKELRNNKNLKIIIEQLNKKLDDNKIEIENIKIIIEQINKKLDDNKIEIETLKKKNKELIHFKKPKGSQCSVEGNKYEKKIHNIIKNCTINDKQFNTQKENELAGSSSKIDIECDFITKKDIGIEVKKCNTPDWMQCSIKYNEKDKKWEASKRGKNPIKCRKMFDNLINKKKLYNGEIPPFINKNLTHTEWVEIKKTTKKWNDKYIDIPSDFIKKLYKAKGCHYIQISNGYGLYHLGIDKCKFKVPEFNIEQQLRIRTKIHSKKNKNGFCVLSVTIACQPKDITKLNKSKYSLDNKDKLPPSLIYKS